MPRTLSPYEVAWRKSVGHAVPSGGMIHDDDELEQMTAPEPAPAAKEPEPPPAPAAKEPEPPPAPAAKGKPGK